MKLWTAGLRPVPLLHTLVVKKKWLTTVQVPRQLSVATQDALVVGKLQPPVLDRRAHALARFLDLHVGQADEREARQTVREMHLDGD